MASPPGRAGPADAARLRRWAANASLSVAVTLAAMKLAVALLTGSVAVLASLVDTLADIAASAITFLSVRVAVQPPDRRHRYGHGKAEALSALAQAALVAGSAAFVLIGAGRRLIDPQPIEAAEIGLVAMLVATATTLALVAYQTRIVRLTGSPAIAADRLHYVSDIGANLLVALSFLIAAGPGASQIDPLFAAIISFWLLYSATHIGRGAIRTLMDHELPASEREHVAALVRAEPDVHDLHDLRTREAAGTRFIEFHVELDGTMPLRRAHAVMERLEARLGGAFPEAQVIIHPEPVGIADQRLDDQLGAAPD